MFGRVFALVVHAFTSGDFWAGVVVGAAIGGAALLAWIRSAERYLGSRF